MKKTNEKKRKCLSAIVLVSILSITAAIMVVADTGVGKAQNSVRYNAKNKVTEGTYEQPTPPDDDHEFIGWATTKAKADSGTVDFNPMPEDLTNQDLNSIINGEEKRVYAVWKEKPHMKYAVAIYGINADGDHTITFGPATGGNYVKTAKPAHIEKPAETASNMCIHNHTWPEIISQIKKDPTVFEDCISNGCTATVKLTPTDTLKSSSWTDTNTDAETGDGPSQLYNELSSTYIKWNNTSSNARGWPASRTRAVLDGYDSNTDTSVAGSDITSINASNCLLSWFPKELQKAIVPKAVKSDTKYNDLSGNNVTTNDKLWLFSGKEIYVNSGSNYDVIRENEGNLYDRASKMNITTSNYSRNIGYCVDGASCHAYVWWLRSPSRSYSGVVYRVSSNGSWSDRVTNYTNGVAPGFVLSGSN